VGRGRWFAMGSNLTVGAMNGIAAAALMGAVGLAAATGAQAGHEVSYYPSFYPQEIRLEPLEPDVAAKELGENRLHAYVGAAPRFGGEVPGHLKSVQSLHSFIVLSFNPQSPRAQDREGRCEAVARTIATLRTQPDVVVHPYPVTPYHADYFGHIDRASATKPPPAADGDVPSLALTATASTERLLPTPASTGPGE
jgi:hypothetical protein